MRYLLLATTTLCLALTACEDSRTYRVEDGIKPPAQWQNGPNMVDTAIQQNWWQNFQDPMLDDLIKQGIANNLDLKIAASRVRQARAQLLGVEADQLPNIGASASVARSKSSILGSNNATFLTGSRNNTLYQAGLDASWEVNIFNIDASIDAARASAVAVKEQERDTLLTLLGEVARNYIALRQSQNQFALTEQTVKAYQISFDLTKAKFDAGLVNGLDTARAEGLWQSTAAQLPPLQANINASKYRLAVLLGQLPGSLQNLDKVQPVPISKVAVVAAAPASVIAERPDIRAAERVLAAATARQTIATREYYPSISLSSAFGWSTYNSSGNLFTGSGNAWSLVGQVLAPLVDFGRIRSDIRVADAQAEQAFLGYQQTVLSASEEVENALSRYFAAVNRQSQLNKANDAGELAVELAQERYKKGLVSFLEVTDAQQKLYAAQLEVLNNNAEISVQQIGLYKALGGGWRTDLPVTPQDSKLEPIVIR